METEIVNDMYMIGSCVMLYRKEDCRRKVNTEKEEFQERWKLFIDS